MTTSDHIRPADQDPDAAPVTEEARLLHGDQAAGEKYEQPDSVRLDGDTLIAEPETGDDDRSR